MNHPPQKAQPFGGIIAVPTDVVLRDLGVQSEEGIHVPGLGKHVGCVTELWGFDDHGSLDRPMLQAQPDLIQSPRILAEATIGSFGRLQLQMEIGWQFDPQPARQRSFPGNEFPRSRRLRYLPLCTNVPSTSILVPKRYFH